MLLLSLLPTFDLMPSHEYDLAHAAETGHDRSWRLLEKPALRLEQHSAAFMLGNVENEEDDNESAAGAPTWMPPRRKLLEDLIWQSGSFSLRYAEMTAGQPSTLTIQFRICISCGGVLPQENIKLLLPGFKRSPDLNDEKIVPGGRDPESIQEITWDHASETLTLTAAVILANGKLYRVDVPISAGIRLPEIGLSAQTGVMVSTNAVNGGPFKPILVQGLLPVGSFTDSTELFFQPATSGAAVQIVLKFAPVMSIVEGENVALHLPNFFCTEGVCQSGRFSSDLVLQYNGTEPLKTSMPSTWRFVFPYYPCLPSTPWRISKILHSSKYKVLHRSCLVRNGRIFYY